ncbi:MAG: GGDEF domain-containing protein [Deltaproteobacteria bacterium]|nr:GGDEF domain-containing protein [Deltaproteobacteria bacterium]
MDPTSTETAATASSELAGLRRENKELRAMVNALSKLQDLVYRDPLTNLRNRRYFEERMAEELAHAQRHQGVGTLLLLDLDDFKRINDERGHVAGDEVLRHVARLIEENIRVDDAVCRIGGDEFAVILSETDEEAASQFISRLREHVRRQPSAPGLSIGTATWSEQTVDLLSLLHQADVAMYADKAAHKGVARAA